MHPALASTLERIAAREDCAPTALAPLYDAVDPEAVAPSSSRPRTPPSGSSTMGTTSWLVPTPTAYR
ncbi:HalOD1 output domain-containing protein [Halobiforma nitratireducens]|uniref:HalOD1 output domain-containing protein n=1 Tax=Halobiforma nitratireducens TaxID=130048 RepID=UPI00373AE4C7